MIVKRIFDLLASMALIVLLSPLLIITAIFVKLTSSGTVFYRGMRAGLNGEPFKIFKFRTMAIDADKGSGTTALNDPRITKIGNFLRSYKIDELPQLINVLGGSMSMVGPRPELLDYAARYVGEEKLILTVKPGITDYSSLNFFMEEQWVGEDDASTVFDNIVLPVKTKLRIKYVKEQSFVTDMKILIMTAVVVGKKILGLYKGKDTNTGIDG